MPQIIEQVVVVPQAAVNSNQQTTQMALFNVDGTPKANMAQAAAQANFAGADITALKVELNAFLVKLRTAGIIAT